MRKLALVCITAFALNGCSLFMSNGGGMDGGGDSASDSDVKAMIKAAEAAIEKSASVDGEWRDAHSKYIKKAKAALAKGDLKTAMKDAKTAKFQGEMGYKQAVEQQTAKPWLF